MSILISASGNQVGEPISANEFTMRKMGYLPKWAEDLIAGFNGTGSNLPPEKT